MQYLKALNSLKSGILSGEKSFFSFALKDSITTHDLSRNKQNSLNLLNLNSTICIVTPFLIF